MNTDTLKNLLELRLAVYQVGAQKGMWTDLSSNAAGDYLKIVFPKTDSWAYYNLILHIVQSKHAEKLPSEFYNLYRCPSQIEEELTAFVKKNYKQGLPVFDDPMAVINCLNTTACDGSFGNIYIGQMKEDIDALLSVIAFHYVNLFTTGIETIPYFD